MDGIDEYLRDLRILEATLEQEIARIIKQKERTIVGMVKNRLYQFGVDADGRKITPTYTKNTIEVKKEKHQRTSHVTLRDKGDWYASFYLEFKNWTLNLLASDEKTPWLIDKYGKAILGFTEQEQDRIILGIIEPEIQKIIDKLNKGKL